MTVANTLSVTGGGRQKENPERLLYRIVSQPTMQELRDTGADLRGHFRLTSGLHSNEHLQCAGVPRHPAIAERRGRELAIQLEPAARPLCREGVPVEKPGSRPDA